MLPTVILPASATITPKTEAGPGKQEIIFSAITGTASRPDTIFLEAKRKSAILTFEIAGEGKDQFAIISSDAPGASGQSGTNGVSSTIGTNGRSGTNGDFKATSGADSPSAAAGTFARSGRNGKAGYNIIIVFKPENGLIGISRARLKALNAKGEVVNEIALTGLSTKALEGENEPPLSRVFEALGYQIDLGWTSLANHCKPERQGDEIAAAMFKKAGKGEVRITAVARYSPDFELPFGYYTNETDGPEKHLVGTLAKAGNFPEHQTLFPRVAGSTSFDPQDSRFGFYVSGPDHAAWSEDLWNMVYHSENVAHATRIYQAIDADNKVLKNAYFVCFEEASNGDYNDYVFLVENVKPVHTAFAPIFNGKNFEGWDVYHEETGKSDPDKNFRIEDESLHVNGRQVGYIITEAAYTNYHLKVDFKWGEKRWPPRENTKRDAGVCYHIAPDAPDKIWQKCIEYQVQEGDAGDFWLIGNTTIEVDGKPNEPEGYARIPKKKDAEYPNGRWNTLEIISYNGKCIHVLNGEVVNYGENASIRSGRILLQSEFAEVFYKNIVIRALPD